MLKLLIRAVLNWLGLALLISFFGWPYFLRPGESTLRDLESATGTGKHLHLMCWDQSDGSRRLLAEQSAPLSAAAREQQLHLGGTLVLQRPNEHFASWSRPTGTYHLSDHPLEFAMVVGSQVLFYGLLTWIDPIGRLWRARRWKKGVAVFCMCIPAVTSLPKHWQDERMREQISEVVQQPFLLLWQQHQNGRGLVVVLRQRPAEVEQELRQRLRLRANDRLAVTYYAGHTPDDVPNHLPWIFGLELLFAGWFVHRWTLDNRALSF